MHGHGWKRTAGALLAVSLLGAACDDGGRRVSFPVDKSKPLATLTDSERAAICRELEMSARDAFVMICVSRGLTAKFRPGGSEQACIETQDVCLREYQGKPLVCKLQKSGWEAGCNATVGDLEACTNDSLALMDSLGISCAMSMEEMQRLSQQPPAKPPSCVELTAKCPSVA